MQILLPHVLCNKPEQFREIAFAEGEPNVGVS